jgi:hypothetical protein
MNQRRNFLRQLGLASLAFGVQSTFPTKLFATEVAAKPFFDISLAEFSFATSLFTGQMNHLDFAAKAKNDFGIDKVEYVSMFFKENHRIKNTSQK